MFFKSICKKILNQGKKFYISLFTLFNLNICKHNRFSHYKPTNQQINPYLYKQEEKYRHQEEKYKQEEKYRHQEEKYKHQEEKYKLQEGKYIH